MRSALIVAALLLAVAAPSRAERLVDLYKEALSSDPRAAAARYDLEASAKGVDQARAALLPSIVFESDTQRDRQRIRSSQNAIIAPGLSEFPVSANTLTLNQPIFRLAAYERLLQSRASVRQALAQA